MGIYRSFAGRVRVRLVTADIPECLQMLEKEKISGFGVRITDAVTLEVTIGRRDLPRLQHLCEKRGWKLEVIQRSGLFWMLLDLLRRPVLLAGILCLVLLAVCIPGRILFLETEGNDTVPTRLILEEAEACGLHFWSRRREVRSEQIKNALLEKIPQLQWVGVNTYGNRAVITVRERPMEDPYEPNAAVSHIAAARDGVVRSCTVTRGWSNCTVGQAVKKGDILISGYTDCGLTYTAERAEGKIMAQTQRSFTAVTLSNCQIQSQKAKESVRFSLLVGKKRINFYKGSGISGGTCDKMYSKYVLTLPGGFALPVALLKETAYSCSVTEAAVPDPERLLTDFAADYLTDQMSEGVLSRKRETVTESEGIFRLTGVYDCIESIGTVQEEKIGEFNGKTDGTDRERRPGG